MKFDWFKSEEEKLMDEQVLKLSKIVKETDPDDKETYYKVVSDLNEMIEIRNKYRASKDRTWIKYVIDGAGIVLGTVFVPIITTNMKFNYLDHVISDTMKYEETGTIRTSVGRSVFSLPWKMW